MTCTIKRGDVTTFSGAVSTEKLHRKFEELISVLTLANLTVDQIGELTNTAVIV